jgi:predicted Rossmann fold flavoprotein
MVSKLDIIVIGGGASGLVAAITAARLGKSVMILEHKEKIGKKILATGNGKCNYTNSNQDPSFYRGDNPDFPKNIFNQFGWKDTLLFFEQLGIRPKEKNGYFYPNSEQASAIVEVLRLELIHLKVKVKLLEHVRTLEKRGEEFCVTTATYSYYSKKVILATGGCSSPDLGSDGSGYSLAKELGHHIVEPVPALTALRSKHPSFKYFTGVRVEVMISLYNQKKLLASQQGELQMTNYGISGIPVFQISRFAAKSLQAGDFVFAMIDFMPEITMDDLFDLLHKRFLICDYKTIEEHFIGLLNRKLASELIKNAGFITNRVSTSISKEKLMKLVHIIKNFKVDIYGTNSFENAQVTAGGIMTCEIRPDTLESKLVSGLFFTGELIDIDGTCGGYNLQWAWSTGYVAGTHVTN